MNMYQECSQFLQIPQSSKLDISNPIYFWIIKTYETWRSAPSKSAYDQRQSPT
jgi:hypothetical protein